MKSEKLSRRWTLIEKRCRKQLIIIHWKYPLIVAVLLKIGFLRDAVNSSSRAWEWEREREVHDNEHEIGVFLLSWAIYSHSYSCVSGEAAPNRMHMNVVRTRILCICSSVIDESATVCSFIEKWYYTDNYFCVTNSAALFHTLFRTHVLYTLMNNCGLQLNLVKIKNKLNFFEYLYVIHSGRYLLYVELHWVARVLVIICSFLVEIRYHHYLFIIQSNPD